MDPNGESVDALKAQNDELRNFLQILIRRDLRRVGKSDSVSTGSDQKCSHACCNQSFSDPQTKFRHEMNFRSHALVCFEDCFECERRFKSSAFEKYLEEFQQPAHFKSLIFPDRKRKHSSGSASVVSTPHNCWKRKGKM